MLQTQLRTFYATHYPDDVEILIDAFTVFGGSDLVVDLHRPLPELITEAILQRYETHVARIDARLPDDAAAMRFLQAIAQGDRRLHSACRRARIGEARGEDLMRLLHHHGVLDVEPSRERPALKAHPKQKLKREVARHRISHKLRFTVPFHRFWFRFVAPFEHRIQHGDFTPTLELFEAQRTAFTGLVFEELSQLYLRTILFNDPNLRCGSYWDRLVELDVLARVPGVGIVAGECKWTNTNVTRVELSRLEEKCVQIGLTPDRLILFAKRGFSKELTQNSDPRLMLVRAEALMGLV